MQTFDKQDTQPIRIKNTKGVKKARGRSSLIWLSWFLFAGAALILMGLAGIAGGYRSGVQAYQNSSATQGVMSIKDQFELGLQDFQSGRYDLARQRFEYVLSKDPGYPDATVKLAETLQILYATATPTALPPTPTLTPTPDLRPVDDLVNQAKKSLLEGNWTGAIDTIVNLRKVNPSFRVVEVDGLLYISLRNRGVEKIKSSDLEGGIYDLALAERFGPLDAEAVNFRELARLYMFGSAFWEAYPDQAVYYFSQVASAAPGLRDASGWTAYERYRASLMQYGDQLARKGDWCKAYTEYDLAASLGGDASAIPTAAYAREQCYPPTPTATDILTETPTPTLTPTLTELPAVSETPTVESLPTQLIPTDTLTPEVTQPPVPTDTSTPEVLPTSTETQTETSTPVEATNPAAIAAESATPETPIASPNPEIPVDTAIP